MLEVSDPDPEVFAAYTAPDGGLTSITKIEDQLTATSLMREADHCEDFDYIDLGEDSSTGNSDRASPSARKRNSSSTNNPIELGSTISECCLFSIWVATYLFRSRARLSQAASK